MKVIEKGTDRSANVHLLRHQRVPPLDEYGEFVNSDDKAIECFVPVEEGQQIKIGGRFSGTTMAIGYDVIIDGICRKHHTYLGKQVALQKNKKLDAEQLLFKTNSGEIVDTELLVAKIPADIVVEEEGARGLGAIEVRVYVLRRFGDEHALQDIEPYYAVKEEGHMSHAVDGNNFDKSVGFTSIAPEFTMTYQKNIAALEGNIVKRVKTKMDKQRPGAEPWAIFRFHFRNKQSILDKGLKMTFDSSKGKAKKHQELQIEELPMLPVGAAPKKDGSSLATPTPSTAPSTPVKSFTDEELPTSKTSSKLSTNLATPPTAKAAKIPTRKEAPAPAEIPRTPERSPNPDAPELSEEEEDEDLRTRVFALPKPKSSAGSSPKLGSMSLAAPSAELVPPAKPEVTPAEVNSAVNGEKVAEIAKEVDQNNTSEASENAGEATERADFDVAPETSDKAKASGENENEHSTATADETKVTANGHAKDKSSDNDMPTHNGAELSNGVKATNGFTPKSPSPQVQKPADLTNGTTHKSPAPQIEKPAELTNGTTAKVSTKEVQKPAPQIKKATASPAPTPTAEKDSVTPAKRPATLNGPRSPEIKRTKLSPTPKPASRASSPAPSNKDRLLFTQLAEARKRAQEIKAKRVATAQKQSNVDEQLSPYQQRIQDEIDKLNNEAEQEARQHEEDEQRLKDSIGWLKELQSGDMEV